MNTEIMIGIIALLLIVAIAYYSYSSKQVQQDNYTELMARMEKLEDAFTHIPSASELANLYNHQISRHFSQINPRESGLKQHELRNIALTESQRMTQSTDKMSTKENEDHHRLEQASSNARHVTSTLESTSTPSMAKHQEIL